jgi:hypothetical protein
MISGAEQMIEDLAELEHQQWCHWTKYFLDSMENGFSDFDKWRKQSKTKYKDLSEEDKEKDRKWARKVLSVMYESARKEAEKIKQKDNKKDD